MARKSQDKIDVIWNLPSAPLACREVCRYLRLDPKSRWQSSFVACWNAFHSSTDPYPDLLFAEHPEIPALATALHHFLVDFGMGRVGVGLADIPAVERMLQSLRENPSFDRLSRKSLRTLTNNDKTDFLTVATLIGELSTSQRKITIVTKSLMAIWGQTPGFDSNVRRAATNLSNMSIPNTAGEPGLERVWFFVLGLALFLRDKQGTNWLSSVREGSRLIFDDDQVSPAVTGRLLDIVLFPIGKWLAAVQNTRTKGEAS